MTDSSHTARGVHMGYLVLVRHGESRWNLANRFTGWTDVPLSPRGVKEAEACARKLQGLELDVAFTSKLIRAHETLLIILSKQEKRNLLDLSLCLRRVLK